MNKGRIKHAIILATITLALTALNGTGVAGASPTTPPGLAKFETAVPAAAAANGFSERLSVWAESDGVIQVGLTSIRGNELQALKAALGNNVNVFQHPFVEPAVKKTLAGKTPPPISKAPTEPKKQSTTTTGAPPSAAATISSSPTPGFYPPFIDSSPLYGGDRIVSYQLVNGQWWIFQCTATAPYGNGAPTYMMTAGHCAPLNTLWYQGFFDGTTVWSNYQMGTVANVQWGNDRIDSELISGATYAPYIWTGQTSQEHVRGAVAVTPGMAVCTDGSFTGYACGGTIDFIKACITYTDGTRVCGLDSANAPTMIVQSGDSGGPVVFKVSDGVKIAGTISGQSNGGKTVWFADSGLQQQIFGVSPAQ